MINVIQKNPYRILGVFSNSPTKDIAANEGRIKAFIRVGRPVSYPLDLLSFVPEVNRNENTLACAKSQIALPDDKVKHAQFWFIKSTQIDDIAFNHLFQGDYDGAVELFKRRRTASSLQNLVVCYLIKGNYQEAIKTAAILYSEFLDVFVSAVDQQYIPNKKNMINLFLNGINSPEIDLSSLKGLLTDPDWTDAINGIVSKPLIDNLEKALEAAKATSGNGSNARLEAGKKLMAVVKINLPKLNGVLDTLKYQILADKLANEILQCGIDYYNESNDDDAAHKAMPIQKYASQIAVGNITKDRCKENLEILQKIIANLPPKEVANEAKAIRKELEHFCTLPDKISHSVTLLNNTKSHIQSIKVKLGSTNPFYLKISTLVVSNALHNLIEEVNSATKRLKQASTYTYSRDSHKLLALLNLKDTLQSAWDAIKIMDSFDIEADFKLRYDTNRSSLKSLCNEMGISTSSYSSTTRSASSRTSSTSTGTTVHISSSSNSKTPKDDNGWAAFWVATLVTAVIGAMINGVEGFFCGAILGMFLPGQIAKAIAED